MANFFAIIMVISFGMMVYYFIKKKTKFALISLAVSFIAFFVVGFTAPSKTGQVISSEKTNTSKKAKVDKKLTSAKDATPILAVLSQSAIEQTEMLDGVKVDVFETDVKLWKGDHKGTTDKNITVTNPYITTGEFKYEGKRYPFEIWFDFDKSDINVKNAKYKIVKYVDAYDGKHSFTTPLS